MIKLSSLRMNSNVIKQQITSGDATYFNFNYDATYFNFIQDNNSAFNASGASASTGMFQPTTTHDLRIKLFNGSFLENFNNFNNLALADCSNIMNEYNKIRIGYDMYSGTGVDGNITISGTKNINTDPLISGRTQPDAPVYSIIVLTSMTAKLNSVPPAGSIIAGDEIVIMNMQGSSTSAINVGVYETVLVDSIVDDLITFQTAKTKHYGSGATDEANIGTATTQQRVILQRVPNYNNLTIPIGTILTCNGWNGSNGGILFIRVAGTLTLYGTITVDGKGYRGGTKGSGGMTPGYQGEGCSGIGIITTAPSTFCSGGGGGVSGGSGYTTGSGGGGGTHKGLGTNGSTTIINTTPGRAASTPLYDINRLKLYFGPAGGGGAQGNSSGGGGGTGGAGGGILIIYATSLLLAGILSTAGAGGFIGTSSFSGSGGGGAGGTLLLGIVNLEVGTATIINSGGGGGAANPGMSVVTGGNGGYGTTIVYYKNVTGTIASTPTGSLYSGVKSIYGTASKIKSTNVLSGHAVTKIQRINYVLERKPFGTDVRIQFSQDNTNQYNALGVQNQYSTLTTDNTTLSLLDLSSQSGDNFYYRIDMTSDGNDSPTLDQLEVDYDPDAYDPSEQYQQSHEIDSVVGARIRSIQGEWELDQTDKINPKIQLLASNTGLFTGEEIIFPAGVGTYYQHGGSYSINNNVLADIQLNVGFDFYRYQKAKIILDTGGSLIDSPTLKVLKINGVLQTATTNAQLVDYTTITVNSITKNSLVKIMEQTISISSSKQLMIIGELELDNTGYDFSNGGTVTNMQISRDGTQLHEKLEARHPYEFQYQKVIMDTPPMGEVKYQIYASETLNKCDSIVRKCNLRITYM